jgi:hypothetical protein
LTTISAANVEERYGKIGQGIPQQIKKEGTVRYNLTRIPKNKVTVRFTMVTAVNREER